MVVGVNGCAVVGGVVCCRWCNTAKNNNTTNKNNTPTNPLQQQQQHKEHHDDDAMKDKWCAPHFKLPSTARGGCLPSVCKIAGEDRPSQDNIPKRGLPHALPGLWNYGSCFGRSVVVQIICTRPATATGSVACYAAHHPHAKSDQQLCAAIECRNLATRGRCDWSGPDAAASQLILFLISPRRPCRSCRR